MSTRQISHAKAKVSSDESTSVAPFSLTLSRNNLTLNWIKPKRCRLTSVFSATRYAGIAIWMPVQAVRKTWAQE